MENVKFENGKINNLDYFETYELFKIMNAYYKAPCIVKYWKQETYESGSWYEASMIVKDALLAIKNGYFERATFKLEED